MEIEKTLELLADCKYGEIYLEEKRELFISLKNRKPRVQENIIKGIRVRAFKNGWGMACSTLPADTKKIVENAKKMAKIAKNRFSLYHVKFKKENVKTKFKINPVDISIEEKISRLKEIDKEMKIGDIKWRNIVYMEMETKKVFKNTERAEMINEEKGVNSYFNAVAKGNGIIQTGSNSLGNVCGYELMKRADERAIYASNTANELLKAGLPKAGIYTVIVDNGMAGLLAHEAIGHACEGDQVESLLSGKTSKQIASTSINLIDDPTIDGNGHYLYDDEGVPAKKNVLIRNGKLVGYLHNRETASKIGYGHPGNARAENYQFSPIVRMSNTFFDKGNYSVSELFDIKNGIYVVGGKGGQVNPVSGEFTFMCEKAYEIKDGEKTRLLRDVTIRGEILKILLNVECVGKDLMIANWGGHCGKDGQLAKVDQGGPHIRIRNMIIGGI